jgi:hypothetical protein
MLEALLTWLLPPMRVIEVCLLLFVFQIFESVQRSSLKSDYGTGLKKF